ncbi:MAG: amidohydrolase, partial [SAR324 cluster bacterium]|nr:amidohydrolase [SAR324 cluster bacterium]
LSIDKHDRPHFNVSIPPPTLDLLEEIASNKNTFVDFSGQYAFSHVPYPYADMLSVSQRLFNIFGAERMLWASDFPWTLEIPGYVEQLNLVGKLLPDISQEEQELIQGGNAERLFRF